jgi:hypothetical protein
MSDFKKELKILVPRKSLYCVWFQAHSGENAPLIRVWIDPYMTMFESQAKVEESDVVAARAMYHAARGEGGKS